MLYLQPVSRTDGREFYDMLQRIPPENGFQNSAYQMDYAEFPAWLEKCANMAQGIGLEDWQVPSGTYWLMDDGVPVAMGKLRIGGGIVDDTVGQFLRNGYRRIAQAIIEHILIADLLSSRRGEF